MNRLIYGPSRLTEWARHGPPYHNLTLVLIVPRILCDQQSIPVSTTQISHTLLKHARMGLSLHTNFCAIQKFWHCWKQYVKVSWRVAQTYPRSSFSSISTPAQPQQRATWTNPGQGIKSTQPKVKLPLTSHPSTGHVPPPEMIDNPCPEYTWMRNICFHNRQLQQDGCKCFLFWHVCR